jgi:hypothetical protein
MSPRIEVMLAFAAKGTLLEKRTCNVLLGARWDYISTIDKFQGLLGKRTPK